MTESSLRFLPEELQIGVAEIDCQHDALFGRVVELKATCLGCESIPQPCADELLRSLNEHYATEERHALAMGMDFSVHAHEHETMLHSVSRALAEAVAGRADVFGVLRYVEYWFERHIATEDFKLGARAAAVDADALWKLRAQLQVDAPQELG